MAGRPAGAARLVVRVGLLRRWRGLGRSEQVRAGQGGGRGRAVAGL